MSVEFRIMDVNRVLDSSVVITESSEDTSFPSTNFQKTSRSQTWRTTGNFVIDASNNKIDFDEGGGELNATLVNATYTPTTLAAEIKTQLEATGAETYTITFSTSTGKWTILHANGAGTLSLLWKTGTNGADGTDTHVGTTIGFSDAADDTGATPTTGYTGDNIAIHTEEWVVFNFGSAMTVDSVALPYDPVIGVTLSTGAVVKIQANASDSWTSPSVDVTLSLDTDDDVFTHFFTSTQNFQYWRLHIVDVANVNLHVEIPLLILSAATTLTQAPEIGFTYARNDQSSIRRTDFGHLYADVRPKLRSMSFSYKNMLIADIETLINLFNTVGSTTPFAIAVDPTEDLFDKDRFFIYGTLDKTFSVKHVITTIFDSGLSMNEVI